MNDLTVAHGHSERKTVRCGSVHYICRAVGLRTVRQRVERRINEDLAGNDQTGEVSDKPGILFLRDHKVHAVLNEKCGQTFGRKIRFDSHKSGA